MMSSFQLEKVVTLHALRRSRPRAKSQHIRSRQSRVHAVHAMVLHTLHGVHTLL